MATPDFMSERGARILCARIEKYWKARGYHGLETEIRYMLPAQSNEVGICFIIRSNIGPQGFPPKQVQ